ncbi:MULTISPECIES: ABC transporter substrate-binding protein [Halocynthiibacter]|uniref:ABC transporter substrate-binding protein n=1 Tax=Halocynthiibacter halioticoli TaxID=2986804 RepID=A0AAE3LT21_9RHOB|nr:MULTISPECIES: ABC transporter substrate-binding protein [Halocynthiibacter]MCV6824351.1 ABC transporter substrate-binding protein [Halocynthiibacter halioticoli]MCW4057352.1 ABC transporter substrate-binding protein [Halocynthiibacter sp. SDUM655004]
MKKLLMATAATALFASAASAEEIKLGVLLGFTGPAESLAPDMSEGIKLAVSEVSDSGKFLDGTTVSTVVGDSTCVDAAAAVAAGERQVTSDKVVGIIGALCSGATGAVFQSVALPNGIVMISPSATSPGLTTMEDDGLFFRASPSDARQGQIMTEVIMERGLKEVAVTYTNNDYGKGLADAFASAFTEAGGTVTVSVAHEDGKADYSAEVGAMASAGGEALVVVGYLDQGGPGIIRAALDTGAFDLFVLPDAMVGDSISDKFGDEIEGSFGQVPGTDSPGTGMLAELGAAAGYTGDAPYAPESYDAAALMLLAMQSAGSTDSSVYKDHVMKVANAPGEQIFPGELEKALEILAEGGEIDYVGGSAVELIEPGESAGNYREIEIKGGVFETVKYR